MHPIFLHGKDGRCFRVSGSSIECFHKSEWRIAREKFNQDSDAVRFHFCIGKHVECAMDANKRSCRWSGVFVGCQRLESLRRILGRWNFIVYKQRRKLDKCQFGFDRNLCKRPCDKRHEYLRCHRKGSVSYNDRRYKLDGFQFRSDKNVCAISCDKRHPYFRRHQSRRCVSFK
jgi:hypothetical protein